MRTITFLLIFFSTFAPVTVSAAEPDQTEAKAHAVERYFELAPVDELMQEMIAQIATQFPQEQRAAKQQTLMNHLDLKTVEAAAKEQLAAHLTLEELNAFIAFMEQPAGKSALSKMKYYMSALLPTIQDEIKQAYQISQVQWQ